jgi:Na+/glutamate symporter
VSTSEDKSVWKILGLICGVSLVYDLRQLPEVTIVRPVVAGVLQVLSGRKIKRSGGITCGLYHARGDK